MPKVTGIVKIYIDGDLLRSKEGAKLMTGGEEKTAQTGYALYGFSSKFVPSTIEFTMAHLADSQIIELNSVVDAEVKFECDSGVSFLITNATITKPTELTGGEGDVAVEMQGDPAIEEG